MKVSVIIPTYKRPLYLYRAINSVLMQDYQNLEVIVIDDNNNDDQYRIETEHVMQSFSNNKKVKYIKHHKNSNGSVARNTGIQNSEGDYVAFLDDDDFFLPNRIRVSVDFLDASALDIGGCCVNYVKRYNKLIYKKSIYNCITCDCANLLDGSIDYGAGSTLMVKRKVLDEIKGFDTTYKRHQDWEFLINILRKYKIVNLPYVGVVICADGIRNNPNTQMLIEMKNKLFDDFKDDICKLSYIIQQRILIYQRLEIFHSYLIERKYRIAFNYYKQIEDLDYNLRLKEIPKIILFCIIGVLPSFMLFIYWIYDFKYRSFKGVIEHAEKRYKHDSVISD